MVLPQFTPKTKDEAIALHFVENSKSSRNVIVSRVKKHNLLPYVCAACRNIGQWNDSTLSLQLDHINGVNNDHRLKNIRWLCPNCHSQTTNFAGRACRKVRSPKTDGRSLNRKYDRPSKEELSNLLGQHSLQDIGRKYGNSNGCSLVREWCTIYGLPIPSFPRGYWLLRKSGRTHEEALAPKKDRVKMKVLTEEQINISKSILKEGGSLRKAAKQIGYSHSVLSGHLLRLGLISKKDRYHLILNF